MRSDQSIKIIVINPNSSVSMTEHLRKELNRVKRHDTDLTVVSVPTAPETIESAYDEALAVTPSLDIVRMANEEGYDAIILACFSDPGLVAAKEISRIPVIGIAESAFHMASMLGARFSILTTRKERIASKREHVFRSGLEHFLASIRSLDLSVAETDSDPQKTKMRIFEETQKAIIDDGAEVIILGCAGMAGYSAEIELKLSVRILDPAAVALKMAEAIVDLGITHSKVGLFSNPPSRPI